MLHGTSDPSERPTTSTGDVMDTTRSPNSSTTTELESSLRVASDNFLSRVERLHALEEQKRELPSSEVAGLAEEVEALSREILGWAVKQAELARGVASEAPNELRPIAIIPPRAMPVVLDEWRSSERALEAEEPGTAAWESARADVERLREEYARAYRAKRSAPSRS
jgi:hypothetical protein